MERRIHVLHVITRLDPGGSAENTTLSVERVNPARFDSFVWTGPGLHGGGPAPVYAQRLQGRYEILRYLVRPIRPMKDLLATIDLTVRLRKVSPEILHLHTAKGGALGRVAARLAGYRGKIIYTPHGHIFSGYGGSLACRVFTLIEQILAPVCDAIIGLTEDEVRQFQAHHAGRPGQFAVIPSGIEIGAFEAAVSSKGATRKSFGFSDKTPLIGFIGRFDPVKGPDLFLKAVSRIRREIPDLRALMIGDGQMTTELQRLADRLRLGGTIVWTGWRTDIPELVAALDLLLVTSRNEGQGRVVVEAGAAGVPTVALANGGVGEVIVTGETGLLAESNDLDALAQAAVELLRDPKRRKRMGSAARQRARDHFSVEVMIGKLEELYTVLSR
ncbi:MAG: glycosyltransferase [bacterium]